MGDILLESRKWSLGKLKHHSCVFLNFRSFFILKAFPWSFFLFFLLFLDSINQPVFDQLDFRDLKKLIDSFSQLNCLSGGIQFWSYQHLSFLVSFYLLTLKDLKSTGKLYCRIFLNLNQVDISAWLYSYLSVHYKL